MPEKSHTWFICSNQLVTGPFSTEAVQDLLRNGKVTADSHIWWKGQEEWISISRWRSQLHSLSEGLSRSTDPLWYLEADGDPIGPLSEQDLIGTLSKSENLGRIRLWRTGLQEWKNLYEVFEIMEKMGLSRRRNKRAPLMGTVTSAVLNSAMNSAMNSPTSPVNSSGLHSSIDLATPTSAFAPSDRATSKLHLRATSISQDGLGVKGPHTLQKGDHVTLHLRCVGLPNDLCLNGRVLYSQSNKSAGIRFEALPAELHSYIVDYINGFYAVTSTAA